MAKNSTLKLWNYLLKEEFSSFDKTVHEILSNNQVGPKKETINKILAYSKSVRGIRTKSNSKILISLN
tara:strand:- start:78 stop:281 length:204 start_codon:yes stop_codon:yes gene_type:complete